MRSLTATRFADAEARGVIDAREVRAAQVVNGHTAATSNRYYVKTTRLQDAKAAHTAWKKVRLSETTAADADAQLSVTGASSAADAESPSATVASPAVANGFSGLVMHGFGDWGRDHPTMKVSPEARRAEWSSAELRWIEEWMRKNRGHCVGTMGNQCHIRKCLDDIIRDKNARRTFHPLHVADSGRLRHGFRKLPSTSAK